MSSLSKNSQPSSRQRKTASVMSPNGKSRKRSNGSVPPPTEKQLQRMIVDYWRGAGLPGTRVAAIPNARAFGQSGLTRGLPDLLVYGGARMKDVTGYIELKTTKGELSSFQKVIHEEMLAAGVPVVVCRSFGEAHFVLVHWGVCKPLAKWDRAA